MSHLPGHLRGHRSGGISPPSCAAIGSNAILPCDLADGLGELNDLFHQLVFEFLGITALSRHSLLNLTFGMTSKFSQNLEGPYPKSIEQVRLQV